MKTTIQIAALLLCAALLLTACGHTHTYGDWVTVRKATCTEAGEQYRVCATCGEMERVSLEAAHDYADGVCRVCGARKDETSTRTTAATTAPTVNTTPADTTTRAEGTVAAADPTETATVTVIGPAVTTVPDSQWSVTEAQAAAQAARSAVEAMRDAKDLFKAARNTTDPAQKVRSIQAAQEQVKTARAHIVTVAGYCAENVSVPLTGGEYATAADHVAAILSRCDALIGTAVTAENAATLDLTLMTEAAAIMEACSQMQIAMIDLLSSLTN